MRIAIVADSHLAARAPECVANWRAAARAVADLRVDLTIHLGDISLDGQNRPEDLAYAAGLLREWPTTIRVVPGNHDMGDGSGEMPLDLDRLAACEATFGAGRWAVRANGWELLGINAQLLGSGTPEEDDQWRWLDERAQAPEVEGRILFLHRPLARPSAAERHRAGRYVAEEAGHRLLTGLLRGSLRAVVSGHVHQALDRTVAGVRHVWMPSCAFVLPDAMQPRIGEKTVGIGLLDLGASPARFELLFPPGMQAHELTTLGFWAAQP
jgi:3',5'-cyclic AMP phosphodiesterase CpdA